MTSQEVKIREEGFVGFSLDEPVGEITGDVDVQLAVSARLLFRVIAKLGFPRVPVLVHEVPLRWNASTTVG
jgi:hypothetical protein